MISPALRRARIPAAVALLLTLTACTTDPADPSPASPGASTATGSGSSFDRAEFSHLHALVYDEQARALYAATHTGVWALPGPTAPAGAGEITPQRVGSGTQDTMGMTLAPDGTLLASGHPGPGEAPDLATPNLGLIRSTDGAETWESLSLAGEVDFHSLTTTETAGALRIAGLDSGTSTVLLSDDAGGTWDRGATVAAHDLAFISGAPDQILATTPDGLQISEDAGQTFSMLDGAPLLVFVETMDNGGVVGIDTGGAVWTASRDATGWESHGKVSGGALEAMTAAPGPDPDAAPILVVSTDEGVMSSADLGATWASVVEIS
ncbi:F510_1955 family glycosylhydrolase [Isoptericola sp. NPDC057391]|uniref:F510_1955 family glycosylhydrolase n=1 Tax=Isoptericola sp. NPDC057391 TaxID=3346117 RepID=UPI00362F77CF